MLNCLFFTKISVLDFESSKNGGDDLLCDDVLPFGWYRFLSYGMYVGTKTRCKKDSFNTNSLDIIIGLEIWRRLAQIQVVVELRLRFGLILCHSMKHI